MKQQINRSPLICRDLEVIADHIAQDSLDAALRFYDAAESAFAELAQMPNMGAVRTFQNSRLGVIGMWPIPDFQNWLIFYRPTDNGIEIIRLIHSARDLQSLFAEEEM